MSREISYEIRLRIWDFGIMNCGVKYHILCLSSVTEKFWFLAISPILSLKEFIGDYKRNTEI